MIKAFIVVNNHAMVRLCRFYEQLVRVFYFFPLRWKKTFFCSRSLFDDEREFFLHKHREKATDTRARIRAKHWWIHLFLFEIKQAVDKQSELCQTVYKIVTSRPDHLCSFVDDSNTFGPDTKLVYRHFATLYFCILSDRSESELAMLDLIQVYVETLDRVFENVCELDLIFNSPKAYTVLDETVVGGLVLEINSQKILTVYDQLQKLEKMHSSLIDKLQVGSWWSFTIISSLRVAPATIVFM